MRLPVGSTFAINVLGSVSVAKQFCMCARPHDDDAIGFFPINQQEIAADMAFAVIAPVSFQGMIEPFRW